MIKDRYREKVRKLLALAESTNPHEAERALVQAKKLMAKYNIRAEDTEIVTVESSSVPRRYLKDFEIHMASCVNAVSGCESFLRTNYLPGGRIRSTVLFVGLASDANMAAYSFEVLHNQVRQFQLKMKENGHTAPERNRASLAWAIGACEKLTSFFDYKEVPESVKSYCERESADYDDAKHRNSTSVEDKDQELLAEGYLQGQRAQLNKAAEHQKNVELSSQ